MVDNPAGPIRNTQMKHTQKTEGRKQEEKDRMMQETSRHSGTQQRRGRGGQTGWTGSAESKVEGVEPITSVIILTQ